MPMSEVEHRLGGCLGLTVTAKHGGKILHRLRVGGHTNTIYTSEYITVTEQHAGQHN